LEGLEKELSEYIEVTDKRIHLLEAKVHKFESLADVSGKGLVKAIETSKSPEQVKGLAHLAPKSEPIDTPKPEMVKSSVIESRTESPPAVPQPESPSQDPTSKVPPVPLPPSYKPVLKEEPEESVSTPPTSTPIVPKPPSTAKESNEDDDKEDKDKSELMSALKKIDEL